MNISCGTFEAMCNLEQRPAWEEFHSTAKKSRSAGSSQARPPNVNARDKRYDPCSLRGKEDFMTEQFTKILVPTDFSAPSTSALALAKTLATTFGASLHLVHVLDDPFVTASFAPDVYAPPPAGLRESWMRGAQTLLDQQVPPEEQAQFHTTRAVIFGQPARAIVDYATAHQIDLIVMGTHGRGGMAHVLVGSVAERVVRTALCPVLTAREPVADPRQTATAA
jgi:universal stress protein A